MKAFYEENQTEVQQRSLRLRGACARAGGITQLAKKSGLKVPTLQNYLAGRDMPASVLFRVARGASVSIAWLVAGTGPVDAFEDSVRISVATGNAVLTIEDRIKKLGICAPVSDEIKVTVTGPLPPQVAEAVAHAIKKLVFNAAMETLAAR